MHLHIPTLSLVFPRGDDKKTQSALAILAPRKVSAGRWLGFGERDSRNAFYPRRKASVHLIRFALSGIPALWLSQAHLTRGSCTETRRLTPGGSHRLDRPRREGDRDAQSARLQHHGGREGALFQVPQGAPLAQPLPAKIRARLASPPVRTLYLKPVAERCWRSLLG